MLLILMLVCVVLTGVNSMLEKKFGFIIAISNEKDLNYESEQGFITVYYPKTDGEPTVSEVIERIKAVMSIAFEKQPDKTSLT